MKKSMVTLLMLVVAFTVVMSGCSNGSSSTAQQGSSEEGGKVNISVFAVQDSSIDIPTNKFTAFVEDKFNIKFN